jgi:hypothetical protein
MADASHHGRRRWCLNVPLALVFVGPWSAITLQLVFKHPDWGQEPAGRHCGKHAALQPVGVLEAWPAAP